MSGEFSSDEIGEIVTMILGTVHPVFVGNFNPVLTPFDGHPCWTSIFYDGKAIALTGARTE